MPNILLVLVQMLVKLAQKHCTRESSTCVANRIPTNLRQSFKLNCFITMFRAEHVCRKTANELTITFTTDFFT